MTAMERQSRPAVSGRQPNFKNQIVLPQTGQRNMKRVQQAKVG
jgi:hypothetical protein